MLLKKGTQPSSSTYSRRPEVNVNQTDNGIIFKKHTPLFAASDGGHEHVVQLLLTHPETNVNQTESYGENTPLMRACEKGHEHVVRHLLGHPGIDVSKESKFGETALFKAVQQRHVQVVAHLLAHPKIDPLQQNFTTTKKPGKKYTTAMECCSWNRGSTEHGRIASMIGKHPSSRRAAQKKAEQEKQVQREWNIAKFFIISILIATGFYDIKLCGGLLFIILSISIAYLIHVVLSTFDDVNRAVAELGIPI